MSENKTRYLSPFGRIVLSILLTIMFAVILLAWIRDRQTPEKLKVLEIHQIAQLALVIARIGHQMCHLAAHFLPSEVGILKFCAADVCAKYREKHRNEGFMHVF